MSNANYKAVISALVQSELFPTFQQFLQSHMCFENLLFYLDVESYKKVTDPFLIEKKANDINRKFLEDGSIYEVAS